MKTIGIFLAVLGMLWLPALSHAAISVSQTQQSYSVTTSKGNVYAAGGTVNVPGAPAGDLVAAGGTVVVTGQVGQDLLAAGGNLSITGKVVDDARIGGGNVIVDAPIGGELVAAAGTLALGASTTIGQDLLAAGGNISLAGTVNGNAKIAGGAVTISGTLNKGADIRANSLHITKSAVIDGDINYAGPSEASIEDGAQVRGKIYYTHMAPQGNQYSVGLFLWGAWFFRLVLALVTAFAIYFLFRRDVSDSARATGDSFWREVLRGLVLLVVVPVVVILLFISAVGVYLGILLGIFYLFAILFAIPLTGILLGELIHRWTVKTDGRRLTWYMAAAGVVVANLLLFVPVVGWIIDMIFFFAAFGALMNIFYRRTIASQSV